jgi:hypothetical protein
MHLHPTSPSLDASLRQCNELQYILVGDLREMLDEPMSQQSRQWMAAVLDTLLEMIPREHKLMSRGGYLREVLTDFPNWSGRVDKLEAEHFGLFDRLTELRDELEHEPAPAAVASLKYSLQEWLDAFASHRSHESALMLDAVNFEIGGGD